jgi:hypothetical protein
VLINLATCHERQGRTATAWAEFKEALALAAKAGRGDRESFARERIEVLEKQLPRLRIDVPAEARGPGLSLRRGEVALGEGAWGEALPVDPGKHTIQASAPGHEGRSHEVQAKAGELTTLRIEPLEPLPSPATSSSGAPPPVPPEATSAGPAMPPPIAARGPRRTAGYVVGGAGLLALWAGGVFGVRAVMKRQESDADCPGGACNARGWSTYEDAQRAARYANVGLAVGAVGLGVGAWLVLSARQKTEVAVSPAGVTVRGRWLPTPSASIRATTTGPGRGYGRRCRPGRCRDRAALICCSPSTGAGRPGR